FMRKHAVVFTGHPVRQELLEVNDIPSTARAPQHLLILGGSQGARILDKTLQELAPHLKEMGMSVWHQCRPEHMDELIACYRELGIDHRVMPFITNIHEAYEWAHAVIARAGAGTVMEIGVVGRPAILVPLPNVDRDHQTKNARSLESQGKAFVVLEGDQFPERLLAALKKLSEEETYQGMLSSQGEDRPNNAAKVIADGVLGLVGYS
ncbi:MAG: UDP-N-acetylglucosamine--N-acetylmuramyl-(pentapeptide) pyrophosphoryl-undecaprenol N-acetylglucosamine transferase, partial [Bdellovibrionales bacterium]|nr:UDP-N-acetylglucosamine--N-acetylmuramyl-(pentapeptide) pyrophosphoryl-undecaprenol N-acetylglucosamine transferase [Bdellovibrionales bacterium]